MVYLFNYSESGNDPRNPVKELKGVQLNLLLKFE